MIYADDVATRSVKTISPMATIKQAADIMEIHNVGFLPVLSGTKIVGVLTDRDLALRGLKLGSPNTVQVERIMTRNLVCVDETSTLEDAAECMAKNGVRRIVVLNSGGDLIGVISMDDLAVFTRGDETVGQILTKIAKPNSTFAVHPHTYRPGGIVS